MDEERFEPRDELSTVRITKATLDDFKSVAHGEIVFSCGRRFVPAGTDSDILGLYGQNGSGKTALIEALSILHYILSGRRVPDEYAECIAQDADFAHLSFEFDFQYPDGRIVKVGYEAKLAAEDKPDDEPMGYAASTMGIMAPASGRRVHVFDEVIRMGGDIDGRRQQYRVCMDTTSDAARPFGPESKRRLFIGNDAGVRDELFVRRIQAAERSQSFLFMDDVISFRDDTGIINRCGDVKSGYFEALRELKLFGSLYLFVIDSRFPALASADILMPFFTRYGLVFLPLAGSRVVPAKLVEHLKREFEATSTILRELIPNLTVGLREMGPGLLKDGSEGVTVELVSMRDGLELPLRDESDGVKKIVSCLSLIDSAFNGKSVTVAIDEFDAGIFEYLLGELLQIMQEYGRGQFIFTSHNLRPLEVLDSDFIWFTTTNPKNRYYHMKNIRESNNLRDVYFREILMGEQDEELYEGGKRFRVVSAFRKAAPDYAL